MLKPINWTWGEYVRRRAYSWFILASAVLFAISTVGIVGWIISLVIRVLYRLAYGNVCS
jgi:preprotein translocase subunit Sss1